MRHQRIGTAVEEGAVDRRAGQLEKRARVAGAVGVAGPRRTPIQTVGKAALCAKTRHLRVQIGAESPHQSIRIPPSGNFSE